MQDDTLKKKRSTKVLRQKLRLVSPNTSEGQDIRQPQPDKPLYFLFLSLKSFFLNRAKEQKPSNCNSFFVRRF